ncbi:hypothetical protein MCOR33_004026 [Pyricularia grisea]|uniref:SPIN90/Ldb17 leucine-rich domain-containing protein n=2 Tax=Pyricularia grisea TaxID=148305 RepID=A0ABQ8NPX1_PYRGI|nr:hypothetical protein MCOR33_004026 [Pyricularia grisea]
MADADAGQSGSVPVEGEEQFWQEMENILSAKCSSFESIDDVLRSWLYLVASCRELYLSTEDDVAACSQRLRDSDLFGCNSEYVRTQIIYSLLQEDEAGPLHVIANFLLLDGRSDEVMFRRMIDDGCFPRLVELINGTRDNDRRLHRLLLELVYEMSRIERISSEDLMQVTDEFVQYMFQVIESLSDDVDDPYHYPIIRVLLVLNEQYMVASTMRSNEPPLTNRVIKVLSMRGPDFRTFGENIILLLNRETETSLQLLILKLLYLLFTTKATYEYFYTNDLRVLLDVIIRNLLDLPNESSALRHTYLRVLYPLLAHTQLSNPPHYKREELIRVVRILGGAENAHFAPADDTTLRLVDRVSKVKWLGLEPKELSPVGSGESEVARKLIGISLSESQIGSSVSVSDVAAVMEKPSVQTPSRRADHALGAKKPLMASDANTTKPDEETAKAVTKPKRVRPEVPKHRHGKLLVPAQPVTSSLVNSLCESADESGTDSCTSTTTKTHSNKKVPPKAPPPRRTTRLKQAASAANLRGPETTSVS